MSDGGTEATDTGDGLDASDGSTGTDGGGVLSCSGVASCLSGCAGDDTDCQNDCAASGTSEAQTLLDAYFSCAAMFGCEDSECATLYCSAEAEACDNN